MNTQDAIDYLTSYIGDADPKAREALSVLVVKISKAANALADVNDIADELREALEHHFGPKPADLSAVEWIAWLANTETERES